MPGEQADILEIVGALHEGVADPDQWTRGIAGMAGLLGETSVMLGHAEFPSLKFSMTGHRVPQAALDMMEGPLANPFANPYIAALPRLPLRRPVNADNVGGQALLEGSALWRDVMAPFDLTWSLGGVLERQPESADFVMLGRPTRSGDFAPDEVDLFQVLLPHLARADRVRRELDRARALAADCMSVLDRLDRGVVMVDEGGGVRFANRAAEDIFRDHDGLTAVSGELRAGRSQDTGALKAIVRSAVDTGVGRGRVAVDAVALQRPSGRSAYSVVAEPLAPGHRERLGAPRGSSAVLFVGDSARTGPPGAPRLAIVYGLSPAEADVAARIAAGQTLEAIAAAQGVRDGTVRTHLKAIFAKVGVRRQTELAVRIAADLGGLR